MSMPEPPNPCPLLKGGLALGAREHRGFAVAWNWLLGILRKAEKFFCLSINGRTGNINVVAGNGIDVTADGNTITIAAGTGKSTDNGGSGSSGGGSSGGGSGGGAGGGSGGGAGSGGAGGTSGGSWTDVEPSKPREESPGTQCNDWTGATIDN